MNQRLNNLIFKSSTNFGRRKAKWENYKLFDKTQYYTDEELKSFQSKRLDKLLNLTYTDVEYYNKLFKDNQIQPDLISLDNFNIIPFLTKEKIIENENKLLNKSIPSSRIRANSTSGSSGKKTVFYSDVQSTIIKAPLNWRSLKWLDIDIGDKELRIWGAMRDIKKSATIVNKIKNYFNNYRILSSYKLDDQYY